MTIIEDKDKIYCNVCGEVTVFLSCGTAIMNFWEKHQECKHPLIEQQEIFEEKDNGNMGCK